MSNIVSVVIPLYNKGSYIARALNSVLAQTFQDFEVIVVNDGSTDSGAEIVRSFFDPRVRLIQQENHGVSVARNKGVIEARGKLIAFLDADDEWTPEHLEVLLRLKEYYPEAGAYATAYIYMCRGSKIRYPYFRCIPKGPWEGLLQSYFKSALLGDPPVSASTVGIPKDVLIEIGGFNTMAWAGEDLELWERIALKYPIAFSWDGIGIYHTEASNRTCNKIEPIEKSICVNTGWKAILNDEVPREMIDDLLEYIAGIEIHTAYRNLKAGRSDLARNNLKCCHTKNIQILKYALLICTYIPSSLFIKMLCTESFVKQVLLAIIKIR